MYLANGESFASLGYCFLVGINTIQDIVHESGKAIWKVLQPIYVYLAVPASEEWLRIADEFSSICKMPNWIGSIDVKHCHIKSPPNAGSLYFNYKSSHSINLLGVSAANCCFTLIDMGVHCENDSDVFGNSSLERVFSSGDFIVLLIRNTPGTSVSIELYFVGDEAFPPKPNLRLLQGENSILQKNIFSGHLYSTRRTTECAFGLSD